MEQWTKSKNPQPRNAEFVDLLSDYQTPKSILVFGPFHGSHNQITERGIVGWLMNDD
jgi:hypothetical protein